MHQPSFHKLFSTINTVLAAGAASANGQQDHVTGEESQGLLSATGEADSNEEEEMQEQGDEEEQSRRNAQPGALARIMHR